MIPDFVFGGVVGVVSVSVAIYYLSWVDRRLMLETDNFSTPLETHILSKIFSGAVSLMFSAASLLLLNVGVGGTGAEILIACVFSPFFAFLAFRYLADGFLTKAFVRGDEIETQCLFSKKCVNLKKLKKLKISRDFNVIELEDDSSAIRFCQNVKGKKTLVEHLIRQVPAQLNDELALMLERRKEDLD